MTLIYGQEIPGEIVDSTVGHLVGDASALRACSLVCRFFTPSSQRYLFSRLSITRSRAAQKLLEDVHMRLKHVQSLSLQASGHQSSVPVIIPLLDRMINLKRVVLDCFGYEPDNEELVRLCCKPTVTYAKVFAYPGNTSANLAPLEPSEAAITPISLKSLYIAAHHNDRTYDWLASPLCPVSFKDLVALGVGMNDWTDFTRCTMPLIRMSSSIEVLAMKLPDQSIGLGSASSASPPLLHLNLLLRLTCFTFSVCDRFDEGLLSILWIISQLSEAPLQNNLKELQIWIYNEHGVVNRTLTSHLDTDVWSQQWMRLDKTLSNPKFSNLQDVYIDVSRTDNRRRYSHLIPLSMPKTAKTKRLHIANVIPDIPSSWRYAYTEFPTALGIRILNEDFQERIVAVRRWGERVLIGIVEVPVPSRSNFIRFQGRYPL
ncbi:hypothetical protein AX16_010873 [Volvariella volvacea WC 439]|nr:hypothetical protein AX16_010873 [Volvariella volvacea WC 439]